jgi:hypothetical protein
VKKRFRFVLTESTHLPHDLVLAGRRVEDEVWRWHVGRIANRLESFVALPIEVEIDVADILYIFISALVRLWAPSLIEFIPTNTSEPLVLCAASQD